MNFKRIFGAAAAAALTMAAAGAASATTITWADLSSSDGAGAYGSIAAPSGTVNVSMTGDYSFAQLNNSGTDYWASGNYNGAYNKPGTSDILGLSDAAVTTITFSAPVSDVYIAFTSWNGADVLFDHAFTVASEGCGFWGCGVFDVNGTNTGFTGDGEVHGILEFQGSISSLTLTDFTNENWHGLTVGVADVAGVPEPATWAAMMMGLFGMGAVLRTRRKAALAA